MAGRHIMTQLLVRASEASSVVRGKRMEYANTSAALRKLFGQREIFDSVAGPNLPLNLYQVLRGPLARTLCDPDHGRRQSSVPLITA
jgi:hypothetical protein